MAIEEVPGTFYGLLESRWMDTELFEEWLDNHFLLYAPPARPLLLLLDGHTSYYQLEALRIAAAESVTTYSVCHLMQCT